ncbi:hypothetical protein L210DRAFT_3543624 [Boletus edulis BED1]|uniref:Uncharacterized protein n=1 Tax=Boletus edulis BED1 TaxID=1328754 RepID=A0AAD4G8I7_BOLED|nr:hypothetical protein L210DRAFT_3564502 [Boletus edulis BED1]KAF8438344.1 hypothetical protein L210DRAFT_3543624 [Boletus edulis BED1]
MITMILKKIRSPESPRMARPTTDSTVTQSLPAILVTPPAILRGRSAAPRHRATTPDNTTVSQSSTHPAYSPSRAHTTHVLATSSLPPRGLRLSKLPTRRDQALASA